MQKKRDHTRHNKTRLDYGRDNGATFQPVTMEAGGSAQIDTARRGGSGTAILRVVATDGVNTAEGRRTKD